MEIVLIASSAIMVGVGPAAVMPVIWGLGATMMLILSLTKGTRGGAFTDLEKVCLVLSGLGILRAVHAQRVCQNRRG